jgi:23S rRNA (cytosine1962-C5)-methyltransferase
LNELALRVLNPEGFLFTASCSYHLREEVFLQLIRHAGAKTGRRLQMLERCGQGPDHPVHLSMPESAYLKAAIFRAF